MIKKTFLIILCMIFMIFHADTVTAGAAAGLLLWYSAVVPALFPFMVLSAVLSASGGIRTLMRPFPVIFHVLGLSEDGWYVLLAGLLCGCPMGAKTCADFLSESRIEPGEARFLFALCNHPSPMFLAGFVYPMFADRIPLSYFAISIYFPLLLLAVPAHWIYRRETKNQRSAVSFDPASVRALPLDSAILNSSEILVKIGGYLVFYSILILAIQHTLGIPAWLRLFLSGILEITTGIRTVRDSLPDPYSAIAAAAIFSFGGFCAMSQTNAVIQPHPDFPLNAKTAGLSIRQYLLWKIVHSALTAAIMAVLTGIV